MTATMTAAAWDALRPRFERAYEKWGPLRLAHEIGTDRNTVYRWGARRTTPSRLAQGAIESAVERFERERRVTPAAGVRLPS